MAKILWTFRDVTKFLEEKEFCFYEDMGHSQSWVKLQENAEPDRFVEVKYNHGFYTAKELKKMILQSGIDESEWIKWASS